MDEYYKDSNNPELFEIIKEIITREQIGESGIITVKYGLIGTKLLLEKIAKLGIIKLTEDFKYSANGFIFLPKGLLAWVKKDYLNELKNDEINEKITKKELKAISDFLETRFYKEYFLSKIYFRAQRYEMLSDLKEITNDLLVDVNLTKIGCKKPEYLLFSKASKIAKKTMLYSHQRCIQNNVEGHFSITKKQQLFLDKMNEFLKDTDMVPFEVIVEELMKSKITQKEVFEIAESLEEKGELFKPRHNYYKTTSIKVKKWLEG